MTEIIRNAIRCPVCSSVMVPGADGKSLFCAGMKRHCFDFSSSGYIHFAPPEKSGGGDSKDAVHSRTDFLDLGFYSPIREAVSEAVEGRKLVVDAGCGEGYYTAEMARHAESVIGFDLSKVGVDAAAKRARREKLDNTFFGVAGIFDMPLSDRSADAVTSIFAPCATAEFCRILSDDGILVAVGAGENHLLGLKEAIYDTAYKNTERVDLPPDMRLIEEKKLDYEIFLDQPKSIRDLFSMTPYYYRTDENGFARLEKLETLRTRVEVFVRVYQK